VDQFQKIMGGSLLLIKWISFELTIASRSAKVLRAFESKFEKYDLVVADELGYISFDKEGSELLFTHLSLRAGRKSTIITTNLSFERWEEIFKDPVMTAAMIDRLTHKSYIVNMNGNSCC
jgi:DNA replication protein DnaC